MTMGMPRHADAAPAARPNILFILADQWRGQALGCAGDPNLDTPHIDRLAAGGVRFSRCCSSSPVCSPYRAMLQSGRWPTRTGLYYNSLLLPPEERCLAEVFGDAGYATGYIGKWHLDGDSGLGVRKGGDRPSNWQRLPENNVRHRQGWQYWAGFNRGHRYFDAAYWTDSPDAILIPKGAFEPDHQTDLAMKWIGERKETGQPWLMTLSWGGPHTPYTAPEKYMKMFKPDEFELRPNVRESPRGDEKKARQDLHGYYAHAKALDDNLGRLDAFLEANGLTDNTIVILTADHGDLHFSNGLNFKGKPHEESINVPFVARWPQGFTNAGRTTDALLGSIDLYPTLCGLCGVPIPDGRDGVDRSDLLRGRTEQGAEDVLLTISEPEREMGWRGLRTDRYTFAVRNGAGESWVLFDNREDPYQMNNLAKNPAHEATRKELRARLAQRLLNVDCPLAERIANTT